MPALSLIICACGERDHLVRLFEHIEGCYNELLVIHDGPDEKNIRSIVEDIGGRFFERPRAFQQEQHWKFAFGAATHDWILRMDPDEFPSPSLQQWLIQFRQSPAPAEPTAGFSCIWPMWNGKKTVTHDWPDHRCLLFDRNRISCVGIPECIPIPDPGMVYEKLPLILEHQPTRKTYGFRNIFLRKRTWLWTRQVGNQLFSPVENLQCWRTEPHWPEFWARMRMRPLRTGILGGLRGMAIDFARCIKRGRWPHPAYWLYPHHIQFGIVIAWLKWKQRR